ncbi:MAG: response regulator transcription factor [Chloroflexi bacterium]|nr:response regulator transcription factor [Ardenticatenaceae bacterium]MBL1130685.1 DNA-binding response regulator [Chloroflexota bacterium]NOG36779.1 response regulator transcription factor [Chloroflexota bacterium]GIK57102.1 MAG: DNA-binding response regulator [Chloroflexota bacterium]
MVIRVLLVDDQALFREGLHTLLSVQADLEVVGAASNGAEAVTAVATLQPDVVLMDLRMPVLDGVTATRRIMENHPTTRVIVLTTFDNDEDVFDGLRAGAVGYLLKDVPSARLYEAIRAAARGESFLQPSITAKVVAEFARMGTRPSPPGQSELVEPLSERELEILQHLATGASNREIANALYITEGTVKNHVTNILGKLGVRDRTQAALKAKDMGLI